MNRYVCLLRAINVAGKNKINMKDLVNYLEQIGLKNISYYVHTGNLVFESNINNIKQVKLQIENIIKNAYSYQITAIIKTENQFRIDIKQNPFMPKLDSKKIYVTFLDEIPDEKLISMIATDIGGDDKWVQINDCIYVYAANGYGRSKITNTLFENKLKIKATSRNWNSIISTKKLLN